MALFPTSGPAPSSPARPATAGTAAPATTGTLGRSAAPLGQSTPGTLGQTAGSPLGRSAAPLGQPAAAPLSQSAAGALGRSTKISDEEFVQLRDFIYEQSGIYIAEARKYLVENRLSNRLRDLNLKSFGEYYYFLRFDPGRRAELTKLFTVITTNETSFWRNPPQLDVFMKKVLPAELEKIRQSHSKKLRIWSAGCSTGEEPYTLAIILHEVLKNEINLWDIKITANDLSESVLEAAKKGIYNEYALRTTPKDIMERYFIKDKDRYLIDSKLKRLISFSQTNLSDRSLLRRVERSHIIFCRNVIIYFDDEMKRQVIESFYDNLLPGGCMLIGHSESLHNISRAFKPEHHPGTIVYRKEE